MPRSVLLCPALAGTASVSAGGLVSALALPATLFGCVASGTFCAVAASQPLLAGPGVAELPEDGPLPAGPGGVSCSVGRAVVLVVRDNVADVEIDWAVGCGVGDAVVFGMLGLALVEVVAAV